MKKIIVIIGPTGSKKSTLAHLIAKSINGEIINADVFQMYKEINIGINKPSVEMQNEIKYHLINNLSIKDKYSIFNYQIDFDKKYDEIIKNHKIPIMCGGSHLYIDSIVKGYKLDYDKIQEEYNKLNNWTIQELEEYLKINDYKSYSKFKNNLQRLKRSVALLKVNNNQRKEILEKENNCAKYKSLIIMTSKDRKIIYEEINKRAISFVQNGWKNEVINLITKYSNELKDFQAMKAIGYNEIYDSIIENRPIDIQKIQQKTRHLVKHQLTWCKNKFDNKILFNFGIDNFDLLISKIKDFWYD